MAYGSIVEEIVIPARHGRAFIIPRGHIARISPLEDGQVGDCTFFNANDYREVFHVGQSWALNVMRKTGNSKYFKHFYSKPPRENVMLTTLEDTYRDHWGNMGGRCSKRIYETRANPDPEHRSCQENLTEALAPYGLTGDDIIDIFNIFMSVKMDGDGNFEILPSRSTTKDYVDLQAEMDVLAAISACPADDSPTNNWRSAPMGVTIFAPG
jgi:uncharacterized protein YcgI (DUF1989 family)